MRCKRKLYGLIPSTIGMVIGYIFINFNTIANLIV